MERLPNLPGDWWADFFSGLGQEYVRQARDEEQTRAESGFIQATMGLPTRARVLDAPCGGGRLALEMADFGYAVTGIDLSSDLIASARRDAEQRHLPVDFRQGDMRRLPEDGEYDGAVCFWNSFGYFDDAGNLDFLRAVSRSLKPGGRLALDTPLLETLLLDTVQEPRIWETVGNLLALQERSYDHESGRLESTWTFIRDGEREVRNTSIRLYTYRELVALLERAGFGLHEAYGDLDLTPFEWGAPWLYLVATRVSEPEAGAMDAKNRGE